MVFGPLPRTVEWMETPSIEAAGASTDKEIAKTGSRERIDSIIWFRLLSQAGEVLEFSVAIAQMLGRHAEHVQQGQLEIGERRVLRIDQVTPALQ